MTATAFQYTKESADEFSESIEEVRKQENYLKANFETTSTFNIYRCKIGTSTNLCCRPHGLLVEFKDHTNAKFTMAIKIIGGQVKPVILRPPQKISKELLGTWTGTALDITIKAGIVSALHFGKYKLLTNNCKHYVEIAARSLNFHTGCCCCSSPMVASPEVDRFTSSIRCRVDLKESVESNGTKKLKH